MTVGQAAAAAVLLVGGVAALLFFGLKTENAPKPVTRAEAPKEQPDLPAPKEDQKLSCRIVPQQAVWAGTLITGTIESVSAEVGQTVIDGQVLARLKSGPTTPTTAAMEQDASRDHARDTAARLADARREASRLQSEVTRARAALAKMEPIFRKQELLNEAGATPRLVFETARADHDRAVKDLAAAEEASRQADNTASRIADELRQAEQTAKEKARAAIDVASGISTAEIHAPAAGLVTERKVSAGDSVTEANREQLFHIAVHPELLRAEFGPGPVPQAGQAIAIEAGGVSIRATVSETGAADFESHLGSVTIGTPCMASVRIK